MPSASFRRPPILPAPVRRIAGRSLTVDQLRLSLLPVLAADRDGMSFYHQEHICSTLEVGLDDYLEARNRLLATDLAALDGKCFQVPSLLPSSVRPPSGPLETAPELETDDPATVRKLIRDSLASTKSGRQ